MATETQKKLFEVKDTGRKVKAPMISLNSLIDETLKPWNNNSSQLRERVAELLKSGKTVQQVQDLLHEEQNNTEHVYR